MDTKQIALKIFKRNRAGTGFMFTSELERKLKEELPLYNINTDTLDLKELARTTIVAASLGA
ncbi:hypothetical protein NB550_11425 [Vibrio parahaemolyticus]|uniref:hypothetical protein n=1 Tax=Vibrio TaxID=662 RepID=UPI00215B848C|nr:hypothetical protein [Vibrio parahaemolyticus]MCR9888171.1 hypothetical protein [Vibrio parahaemolyticus]MCR9918101.1 hypothetical protein [Vibrio parahaemolyticus]